MKNLFSKLSQLQAQGYTLGYCSTILEADKSLTLIEKENFRSCVVDYTHRILKLQNEIVDFVNDLNGEKVY